MSIVLLILMVYVGSPWWLYVLWGMFFTLQVMVTIIKEIG